MRVFNFKLISVEIIKNMCINLSFENNKDSKKNNS